MDPRIERAGLTKDRRIQAVLTARSIMKAYGPAKALGRVAEMTACGRDSSEGNRQFYTLVEELVTEAVAEGTINGGPLA